ncbi:hypothetical protein HMI56_001754 [Coelomomyces lativittatus]|nr:hypothetical protein HMI56_001754 [Coelomomyces lativittatus]
MNLVFANELISDFVPSTVSSSELQHPLAQALLQASPSSVSPSTFSNVFSLYCPNPKCRCVILKASHGLCQTSPPCRPTLPSLPSSIPTITDSPPFWFEVKDKLTFENIGFSKPTEVSNDLRYLCCAERLLCPSF